MKKVLIISFLFSFFTFVEVCQAEEGHKDTHKHEEGHRNGDEGEHGHAHEHDHEGGKALGKEKAIVEVSEKKGFRLSPEAISTIGLEFAVLRKPLHTIHKKSLVSSKNKKGIYRYREGFFKFIEVKVLKTLKESSYLIEVPNLQLGDQIVTHGVGLLRVSDIYSTDTSEYGHSH